MVSDGYTHWVILQVAGGALVSVAPLSSLASVYVAPTVRDAVAMPVIGDNLRGLCAELARYGVVV